MTKNAFTHARQLAELTAQTRNKIARSVFDFETIKEQITIFASQGHCRLRVLQEAPLDLSDTQSAKALCDKLKKHGYEMSWAHAHVVIKHANNVGENVMYQELVITWGVRETFEAVREE